MHQNLKFLPSADRVHQPYLEPTFHFGVQLRTVAGHVICSPVLFGVELYIASGKQANSYLNTLDFISRFILIKPPFRKLDIPHQ